MSEAKDPQLQGKRIVPDFKGSLGKQIKKQSIGVSPAAVTGEMAAGLSVGGSEKLSGELRTHLGLRGYTVGREA